MFYVFSSKHSLHSPYFALLHTGLTIGCPYGLLIALYFMPALLLCKPTANSPLSSFTKVFQHLFLHNRLCYSDIRKCVSHIKQVEDLT